MIIKENLEDETKADYMVIIALLQEEGITQW